MQKIKEPNYVKLLEYARNGLVEQVHYGVILLVNKNGIIKKIGNDNDYKFYHRSCMKPMQFSPVIDMKLDEKYNLTLEEIAVCCASHTGDEIHQEIIKSILNKIGFEETNLLCHAHQPLSINEQRRLLLNGLEYRKIHNNCSGKHTAMLLLCKELGFDISTYKNFDNDLTEFIINKICELCEESKDKITVSKDGCGLPVVATSLEKLAKGFLNLFTNIKYKKISEAFLNYPYLIGGDFRLDSEIINASNNLVAKVGACGLCVVVNKEKEECLVVKIADSNMEARSIVVINALLQLKWLDSDKVVTSQINNIYNMEIQSQDNEILGNAITCFNFN